MKNAFKIGLILLLSGCAGQTTTPGNDVSQRLLAISAADLANADADAVAHGDLIAHACYPVLSAWIVAQQGRMRVPVTGAFGTFQRGRDVYGTVGAGIPVELQIGCAALVIDTQAMILKLATIGGL